MATDAGFARVLRSGLFRTLAPAAASLFDSFEYAQDFDAPASANGSSNVARTNDSTLAGWAHFFLET